MRPRSIFYFDLLYGFSLVVSGAQIALEPANPDAPTGVSMGVIAVAIAVALLVWYAISVRASNVMRWIFTILSSLSVLMTLALIATTNQLAGWQLALSVVTTVVDVLCIYMLFTQEAKDWFASGGSKRVDPASAFR